MSWLTNLWIILQTPSTGNGYARRRQLSGRVERWNQSGFPLDWNAHPRPLAGDRGEAYTATLSGRHRVFVENVLPMRKTKGPLQLMWLAMKDQVSVRNTASVQIRNSDNDPL